MKDERPEHEDFAQTGARIVGMMRAMRADMRAMSVELRAACRRLERRVAARTTHYNRLMEQNRRAVRLGLYRAPASRTRPMRAAQWPRKRAL